MARLAKVMLADALAQTVDSDLAYSGGGAEWWFSERERRGRTLN